MLNIKTGKEDKRITTPVIVQTVCEEYNLNRRDPLAFGLRAQNGDPSYDKLAFEVTIGGWGKGKWFFFSIPELKEYQQWKEEHGYWFHWGV